MNRREEDISRTGPLTQGRFCPQGTLGNVGGHFFGFLNSEGATGTGNVEDGPPPQKLPSPKHRPCSSGESLSWSESRNLARTFFKESRD